MSTITVSYSEMSDYRQCRYKHQLAHLENWKPQEVAPALSRGTLFHEVMEAHYRALRLEAGPGSGPSGLAPAEEGVGPLASALEVLQESDHPEVELVEWVYKGYVQTYGFDPDWEIVDVERPIRAWLPTDRGGRSNVRLQGKIDLVVKWRGDLWIVDHKTCKDLPKGRETDLDDQLAIYIYLLRRAGLAIRGAIYNACRTTRLKTREMDASERFARILSFRTDEELFNCAREVRDLAKEAYARRVNDAPRSPNPDTCRWRCPFTEACLYGRKGGNVAGFLGDLDYHQDDTPRYTFDD